MRAAQLRKLDRELTAGAGVARHPEAERRGSEESAGAKVGTEGVGAPEERGTEKGVEASQNSVRRCAPVR